MEEYGETKVGVCIAVGEKKNEAVHSSVRDGDILYPWY